MFLPDKTVFLLIHLAEGISVFSLSTALHNVGSYPGPDHCLELCLRQREACMLQVTLLLPPLPPALFT